VTDAARSDFRFVHHVDVRFRDLDPAGHAHHSLPVIYWEEARSRYWDEVAGRSGLEAIDYIMAELRVRYRARIRYPARLAVAVRVSRIGRSSFDMEYGLWAPDGQLLASGRSSQVMYDYARSCTIPMDPETRARIQAFEGLSG
jgi:acyl-CoA thioester hydrolase